MFWLSYECFTILYNAFLLKSVISSNNSFALGIPDKKAPALEIPQSCVTSLGNPKPKIQGPWKFHMIFFGSPLEISLLFLLTPTTSTCYFFYTPGNSISSNRHVWFFSRIAQYGCQKLRNFCCNYVRI